MFISGLFFEADAYTIYIVVYRSAPQCILFYGHCERLKDSILIQEDFFYQGTG